MRIFPNVKVGYLPQEPRLDDEKTVYENILDGVREKLVVLDRQEEVSTSLPFLPPYSFPCTHTHSLISPSHSLSLSLSHSPSFFLLPSLSRSVSCSLLVLSTPSLTYLPL